MTEQAYERASNSICERLEASGLLHPNSCVHSFWPQVEWREPNIRPFIQLLQASSVRVCLPVITSFSRTKGGNRRLEQVEYTRETKLHRNQWGIDEPDGHTFVSTSELDLVIVPALAADRLGYRLGFGGGFYDEFLEGIQATIVCPMFSSSLVSDIPREKHDIPVDMIITDAESIDTKL